MKILPIINIILMSLVLGGCLYKTVDGQANADNISKNADSLTVLTNLVASYHKDEKTKDFKKKVRAVADEIYLQKEKDKRIITPETVKVVGETASGISGAVGVPFGGPAVDILTLLLMGLAGKKGNDYRLDKKRKREERDELLANSDPEIADKIRKVI